MIKTRLLFFIISVFSTTVVFADDFDEFADGPGGPPNDAPIDHPLWILLIFSMICLFVFKKNILKQNQSFE